MYHFAKVWYNITVKILTLIQFTDHIQIFCFTCIHLSVCMCMFVYLVLYNFYHV